MINIYSDAPGPDQQAKKLGVLFAELAELPDIYDLPNHPSNSRLGHDTKQYHDERMKANPSWYGNLKGMAEVDRMIEQGWPEAIQRTKDVVGTMVESIPGVEAIRRRPRWGEEGEEFDVDRGLRGDWDVAFQSPKLLRTSGTRIVTIYGSYGGNCNRTSEEMFWNGIQLVIAADIIENAGYQCEVIGVNGGRQYSGGDYGINLLMIRAKEAGGRLRLDNMAMVFAHPAVFRTYMFKGVVASHFKTDFGLGQSVGDAKTLAHNIYQAYVNGWCPEPTLIIPEAFNKEGAVKNITKLVSDLEAGAMVAPDFTPSN